MMRDPDTPVLGCFRAENHNGVILPISLFMRTAARNRMDPKTAIAWAVDLKHWALFYEAVRCRGLEPPYDFDLFDAGEDDLLAYRKYLTGHARNQRGEPISPATASSKLYRVCEMYQWWADQGWYHRSLGDRAERRTRRRRAGYVPMLAHTHRRGSAVECGPMGSAHARIKGEKIRPLPRSLLKQDIADVEAALKHKA
jgi:hypothetical protein